MNELSKALENNFVIVNLGSGGDSDYDLSEELRAATILVEVDAADDSRGKARYLRREKLNKTIAGEAGEHKFRINNFVACSSLREPDKKLISRYGLDNYYKAEREETVECTTLPVLLSEYKIESVDFLKTDLEGEDFYIVKSMESYLNRVLALQCELRFEPFYKGEPNIYEVAEHLRRFDFELIGLRPEYWKPKTENSHQYEDGRIVWADCLFLKKPKAIVESSNELSPGISIAKQIVILSMLGRKGYAAYLNAEYGHLMADEWRSEILKLIEPSNEKYKLGKRLLRSAMYRIRQVVRPPEKSEFKFEHLAKW